MVKLCPIFIVAGTAIIFMSFGVLCYLIKTINPKQILENSTIYESPNIEFIQEFDLDDNLEYGLEKFSDNATLNVAQPANTINNINSFSSGDGTLVPTIWPYIKKNYSDCLTQENESKLTDVILSQKGQRRSIKHDDDIKNPHSLILNLGDVDGPKIIIQLGTEHTNKGIGRKRSSGNKHRGDNKTIITIEVNEYLLLNIIGNSIDTNFKNEMERNIFRNELEFVNDTFNKRTEINKNGMTFRDTASTKSFDMLTDTSNSIKSETNYKTNSTDFVKNVTIDSMEDLNYANISDTMVANTTVLDTLSTITELNDPVVDLLIRGDMLKDGLLNNKIITETYFT